MTLLDVLFMDIHLIIVVLFELSYWMSQFDIHIKHSAIFKKFFPSVAYVGFVIFTCTKVIYEFHSATQI